MGIRRNLTSVHDLPSKDQAALSRFSNSFGFSVLKWFGVSHDGRPFEVETKNVVCSVI